jgi:hypothetical protein
VPLIVIWGSFVKAFSTGMMTSPPPAGFISEALNHAGSMGGVTPMPAIDPTMPDNIPVGTATSSDTGAGSLAALAKPQRWLCRGDRCVAACTGRLTAAPARMHCPTPATRPRGSI